MRIVDLATVEAIGWALVHFAWQGALAAAAFAALDLAARGASARLRYALATATLAVMALLPPLTVIATRASDRRLDPAPAVTPHAVAGAAATAPGPEGATGSFPLALSERIGRILPALVAAWCAGVLVFSIRYLGGWRLVRRIDRLARPLGEAEIGRRMVVLARRMRVSRPVRLLESALVEVPTVVGWLRPAILLPVATLAGLTSEQLEAVLAHELAHVRRHDYLVGLLQAAVETLLFYQPGVWWVSHRMRVERELCCDDEAVDACGDPIVYAHALAGLEALRPAPRLAPAATGGPLFDRIARLVAPRGDVMRASRGVAAVLAGAALVLAVTGVTSLRASARAAESPEVTRPRRRAPVSRTSVPPAASSARPEVPRPAGGTDAPATEASRPAASRPVPVERLLELASAGVTPEYVDGLSALGYPGLSWDQLIALRTQGVGPDYVRGMAEAGHPRLTPDQLLALRTQGVSPEYVRALGAERLGDLSLSDLLALRTQGVSPEYVRGLRAAGYDTLSVTDLLGARTHGVSAEDAVALRAMGYTDLTVGRLVGLRTMGVTSEYVRGLQAQGYKGLSVPVLIGLRTHGVSPEYIRELKDLGYSGLAAGELIELRSQGVTPEFVRELKDAGYDRLTTRELIDLRAHGVGAALLRRLKARGEEAR